MAIFPDADKLRATIEEQSAMIALRAMTVDEFSDYCDYFVVDYADEIVANYGYTLEKSRAIASTSLTDDLPLGAETPDNFLFCIEKDAGTGSAETVGYLWYKLLDDGETVFILDFYLFEPVRGQGHGKAALAALEQHLLGSGVEQIKLRVAAGQQTSLGPL